MRTALCVGAKYSVENTNVRGRVGHFRLHQNLYNLIDDGWGKNQKDIKNPNPIFPDPTILSEIN